MRAELDEAYRQARYRVLAPAPLELAVDVPSPALDELLRRHACTTAALVTAANPRSRPTPIDENDRRHAQLLQLLAAAGHRCLPTVATDPAGSWPDERGALTLDITREQAIAIARAFGQNAILWCEAGRAPQLLWSDAGSAAAAHLDQHRGEDGSQA